MKKWIKNSFAAILAIATFIALPLIFPAPLFAYGIVHQNLSVHAARPIPEREGKAFLAEVHRRLGRFPQLRGNQTMQIYIANKGWRQNWLWIIARKAGGFVAPPATRTHTYFSGADFQTNELIAPTGYRPKPPRTLAYYGTHELSHVTMAKKLGWVRFHLMPLWVREGLPDYIAMPPETAKALYRKIGQNDASLPMMKSYGVYAPYRLLVAYFLEHENWSLEKLMASDLSLSQARAIAFKSLDKASWPANHRPSSTHSGL